jgi:hypothetical protein
MLYSQEGRLAEIFVERLPVTRLHSCGEASHMFQQQRACRGEHYESFRQRSRALFSDQFAVFIAIFHGKASEASVDRKGAGSARLFVASLLDLNMPSKERPVSGCHF